MLGSCEQGPPVLTGLRSLAGSSSGIHQVFIELVQEDVAEEWA
jgi:hypothetical protein